MKESMEAEQFLIACGMIDENKVADLLEIPETWFSYNAHKLIIRAIKSLAEQGLGTDMFAIAEHLKQHNQIDTAGGMEYIVELSESLPSIKFWSSYKNSLLRAYKTSQIAAVSKSLQGLVESNHKPEEIVDYLQESLINLMIDHHQGGLLPMSKYLDQALEDIQWRIENDGAYRGASTGFAQLDEAFDGFENGKVYVIAGRTAMGKALTLDAKILQYDGTFKPMKDIEVGDKLASVDGADSFVSGVFPQGKRDVCKVTFDDGRTVEADLDHLWTITSSRFKGQQTLTTHEIKELLKKDRYQGRIRLVGHSGDFGKHLYLGVSPWTIGMLIGDGCLTESGVRFSNPERYMQERLSEETGMTLSMRDNGIDGGILGGPRHSIRAALTKLGLMGCHSYEKFIPDVCFTGTKSFRYDLLAGLLESDGWIEKHGSVMYSTASKRLCDDIIKLVQSLGGKATYSQKERYYSYKGDMKQGRDAFSISIALDDLFGYLKSPRLLKNKKERTMPCTPVIRSIEVTGSEEVQCISVTHPSKLFLFDDYIVTHNTQFALNLALRLAQTKPVCAFSLEMTGKGLSMRAICNESRVFNSKMKKGNLSGDEMNDVAMAVTRLHENSQLFIDESSSLTTSQIRSRLKAFKLAHKEIGAIVIDHIGLVKKNAAKGETEALNEIVHDVARIAKEFDCPVLELAQLNRGVEGRPNKRPVASDLKQSGAIEEDARGIMLLYRDEYYNPDTPDKNITEVNIAKNSDGDTPTLYFRHNMAIAHYEELDSYQPDEGITRKAKF